MRLMPFALAAAAALAAPAFAQAPEDEPRVNQLIVYGDDRCPEGGPDEIIVCARKPESERYRVPEPLREDPERPANVAWGARAVEVSSLGRSGIGSCSANGPGGYLGCFNQSIQQARAERDADGTDWKGLVEDARRARLARLDEEAEAVERELRGAE